MFRSMLKKTVLVLSTLAMLLTATGCQQEEKEPEKGWFDYYTSSGTSYSTAWKMDSNVGQLDSSTKDKYKRYTTIKGNNKDQITILIYMCGTDLESKSSMASYDLQEMAKATYGNNINIIIYTGGCTNWHIQGISTKYNQIWRLADGSLEPLVENAGTGSMVDPDTLVSFIEYGVKNYKANRYELIFWDHGGGSISGYGYDEKNTKAGSMDLAKIDQALTEANVKFDFIGFDACLMATVETALMLGEHADYMFASEESEPGIGWYYTDWLTALGKNTSMSTIEIGKAIADSFVSTCKSKTPSQPATLSVVDLAEIKDVIPAKLTAFAKSANKMLENKEYQKLSSARSGAREFAQAQGIDMVDLVDMAHSVGNKEADELVDALLGCIKYNNVSNSMSNSYGLSVYFPYRSKNYLNQVVKTYEKIDMNEEYTSVIRNFASYGAASQVTGGGNHSAYQSFSGYDTDSYYSSQSSSNSMMDILQMFVGGTSPSTSSAQQHQQQQQNNYDPYSMLFGTVLDLLLGSMSNKTMVDYIVENHFDADLSWKNGKIAITEEQWKLVEGLKLNAFYDDGNGYIDLGKDDIFDIDSKGNLLAIKKEDFTWVGASADGNNWQVIPYYFSYSTTEGDNHISNGRIPVLLNGDYADLLVVMDNDGMEVVGACFKYEDSDAVAKNITEINPGDEIQFVCDYYDYNGNFVDNYVLGDKLVVVDRIHLGDVRVDKDKTILSYEIKDIYQQVFFSEPMK